jgi:transposase InsO family protein
MAEAAPYDTGIDDHSRYCAIATVVPRGTGRAVCTAFVRALLEFGCPDQVLTDNGKQFTGRFTRPRARAFLFSRGRVHRIITYENASAELQHGRIRAINPA